MNLWYLHVPCPERVDCLMECCGLWIMWSLVMSFSGARGPSCDCCVLRLLGMGC